MTKLKSWMTSSDGVQEIQGEVKETWRNWSTLKQEYNGIPTLLKRNTEENGKTWPRTFLKNLDTKVNVWFIGSNGL